MSLQESPMSPAFGARSYATFGVESAVASSDPHQLILMLYDGALGALNVARGHLQGGRVPDKCAALVKATRIVEEGLKASVDRTTGELAGRLVQLYDYMVMRLLQANLRNDAKAIDEVTRLLTDLREAWVRMGAARKPAAAAPVPAYGAAAAGAPRRMVVAA